MKRIAVDLDVHYRDHETNTGDTVNVEIDFGHGDVTFNTADPHYSVRVSIRDLKALVALTTD